MKKYEPEIENLTLIPSDGGRYEINVNGTLVYSKLSINRHAEPGEVEKLVEKYLKEGK